MQQQPLQSPRLPHRRGGLETLWQHSYGANGHGNHREVFYKLILFSRDQCLEGYSFEMFFTFRRWNCQAGSSLEFPGIKRSLTSGQVHQSELVLSRVTNETLGWLIQKMGPEGIICFRSQKMRLLPGK